MELHAGAGGKALLAYASEKIRNRALRGKAIKKLTPATIVKRERLEEEGQTWLYENIAIPLVTCGIRMEERGVPREGGVSGRAVVDGAITQIGRLSSPVTLTFEEGRLTLIEGGAEASRLERLLGSLEDDNAYRFAAWGLGTNQGAALVGEDPSFEGERMYGWGHVSTGSNATLPGGTVQAKIHLDGIIATPTVYLDGEVIAEEGRFDI